MTIYLKWKNVKDAEGNEVVKGDTFIPGVIAINIQFERNTIEIKYRSGSVQVNTFELSELEDINWYLANPGEMLTNEYAKSLNKVGRDSSINAPMMPVPFSTTPISKTGKFAPKAESDLNDLLKNMKGDSPKSEFEVKGNPA